jgi:hypothetical protein
LKEGRVKWAAARAPQADLPSADRVMAEGKTAYG